VPEAVECARACVGRETRTLVDDVQLDPAVSSSGAQADRAPRWSGLDRIREQVVEHLLDPAGSRSRAGRRSGRLDAEVALRRERVPCLRSCRRERGDVHCVGGLHLILWAREREELRDEPREAISLGYRSGERLAPGRRDVALEVLEPQPQRRQRGP
jgi:hypothetical protein